VKVAVGSSTLLGVRLAKFLANAGVASRRASEQLIRGGRVNVGGHLVTDPARDVQGSEAITVDGKPVRPRSSPVVYAVNKPAGVVSTASDTHGRPTVVSLVRAPTGTRLYPVGRLDLDTTGLILLTNDGELAHRLMHPSFEVPKTYRAVVANPPVGESELKSLRNGVELEDGLSAPAKVRKLGPGALEITIHEGRKRQVRRMCEAVGHPVKRLERVAFGALKLGGLGPGASRQLSEEEIGRLLRTAQRSARAGRRT
jgi:23S rRNA pseudouridine2605 synthase